MHVRRIVKLMSVLEALTTAGDQRTDMAVLAAAARCAIRLELSSFSRFSQRLGTFPNLPTFSRPPRFLSRARAARSTRDGRAFQKRQREASHGEAAAARRRAPPRLAELTAATLAKSMAARRWTRPGAALMPSSRRSTGG